MCGFPNGQSGQLEGLSSLPVDGLPPPPPGVQATRPPVAQPLPNPAAPCRENCSELPPAGPAGAGEQGPTRETSRPWHTLPGWAKGLHPPPPTAPPFCLVPTQCLPQGQPEGLRWDVGLRGRLGGTSAASLKMKVPARQGFLGKGCSRNLATERCSYNVWSRSPPCSVRFCL